MQWLSLQACREAIRDVARALRNPSPRCTCIIGNPRGTAVRACPKHGDRALR